MSRTFLLIGAVFGALAVALGAFAAHGLASRYPPDRLAIFETGARYQMYHALALVLVATCLGSVGQPRMAALAGWCFTAGILLFSGSLYLLVLAGVPWLGAVTPFGGLAFIAGWVCLALAAIW